MALAKAYAYVNQRTIKCSAKPMCMGHQCMWLVTPTLRVLVVSAAPGVP